jgi:hypothetical protein
MRFRFAIVAAAGLAAVSAFAPAALPASSHAFNATYRGKGHGQVTRTGASGTATAVGRGAPIGRSTLIGSARGVFTTASCLTFRGSAALEGPTGTIRLAARGGKVCPPSVAATVGFSGTARVTGGTAKFAGASGTLRYTGRYVGQDGSLTITFKGHITY